MINFLIHLFVLYLVFDLFNSFFWTSFICTLLSIMKLLRKFYKWVLMDNKLLEYFIKKELWVPKLGLPRSNSSESEDINYLVACWQLKSINSVLHSDEYFTHTPFDILDSYLIEWFYTIVILSIWLKSLYNLYFVDFDSFFKYSFAFVIQQIMKCLCLFLLGTTLYGKETQFMRWWLLIIILYLAWLSRVIFIWLNLRNCLLF